MTYMTTTKNLTFRRVAPGHYVSTDGRFEIKAWSAERFGAHAGTRGYRLWDLTVDGARVARCRYLEEAKEAAARLAAAK